MTIELDLFGDLLADIMTREFRKEVKSFLCFENSTDNNYYQFLRDHPHIVKTLEKLDYEIHFFDGMSIEPKYIRISWGEGKLKNNKE